MPLHSIATQDSRLRRAAPLLVVIALASCGDSGEGSNTGNAAAGTGQGGNAGNTTSAGAGGDSGVAGSVATAGEATGGASSGGMGGTAGSQTAGAAGEGGAVTAGAGGAGGDGGTAAGGSAECGVGGTLCFDFEDGQIPQGWAPVTNSGAGSILVDNTRAHGGSYALHVADGSGQPMHSLGFTLPDDFGGVMWGRVYMYLTPEGPAQHGATLKARYADAADTMFGPENLDWYEVGLGHGSYETIWHSPQPPTGLPEWEMIAETPVTLDQWYCQEFLFDGANEAGDEAALPRMWIDGSEIEFPEQHLYPGDAVKPVFDKATHFILLEVGLIMYHPLDSTTNLWMDDLALGPQRIGCQ